MRLMAIIIGILASLYGGYWFVGSSTVEKGAASVIDNMRAEGWLVEYDALSVRGFPSRFDTRFTALDLAEPGRTFRLQMPEFRLFALSYQPNKVIALWPATQTINLPGEVLTLDSDGLRASAKVGVSTALPLDSVTLEAGVTRLTSDAGWAVTLDHVLAAFRVSPASPDRYDAFAEGRAIGLPDAVRAMIDPAGSMPATLDLLRIDTELTFNGPLALAGGMTGDLLVDGITLRETRLTWGTVGFNATGTLVADARGMAEGAVTLEVTDWSQLIALAVNAGAIDAAVAPTWDRAATMMAAGEDSLRATITLRDGMMSIGPLPLGPAPRLH